MISAGIDIGSSNAKAVLLQEGEVLSSVVLAIIKDSESTAEEILDQALKKANLPKKQIQRIGSTGIGAREICWADQNFPELVCDSKGASWYFPSVKTIIDIGAESYTAGKVGNGGSLLEFATNDRCAAGTGIFIEEMANALQVNLDELGALAIKSKTEITMTFMCTVFAESEVVSLVHKKVPVEDIVRAILDSVAFRVTSLAKRVGLNQDITLIGGCAQNIGIVSLMEKNLGMPVLVPENPVTVGALGAAILVQEQRE